MNEHSKHWDFVLTCFEPIVAVTGGIGTYTRMLLQHLDRSPIDGRAPRILFFTAEANQKLENDLELANVRTEYVATDTFIDGVPFNNLRDPFLHFSFNVMRRMQALQADGHSFGTVEFPDYNAEGYYPVKARAYGLLQLGQVAVRLHSPLLMLHEDNAYGPVADPLRHRFFDAERYVYRNADRILFGGDAMRDRVAGLLGAEDRTRFLSRAMKIPHPWPSLAETGAPMPLPRDGGRVHVGYVGRLELRKGVDLLAEAAREALDHLDRPVTFHLFGRDTTTWHGASMRARLQEILGSHEVSFEFHDYVPQAELRARRLPAMDLFVFPSRFENYPNVLLEVLGLGRPILVSRFGCMPEMGEQFDGVTPFDPFDREAFSNLLHEKLRSAPERVDGPAHYRQVAATMNEALVAGYQKLFAERESAVARAPSKKKLPSIAFVVPHYNHSGLLPLLLDTLVPQMEKGDELIVVDDCSGPVHVGAARAAVEAAGGTFLTTGRNSGPSRARNIGARHAKAELIYFVDADDELVPDTVATFRRVFAESPSLEVASGFMRAFGDQNHYWAAYDPMPATILQENSSHAGIVIRRSSFERSGGYSDALRLHYEDWEFHARLTLSGVRFEILPIVSYRYRIDLQHGRNSVQQDLSMHSYEHVVHSSLASIPPERLATVWPELRDVFVNLLRRKRELEIYAERPPELRYRIADTVNDAVKKIGVHRPLKKLLATTVRGRR